MCIYVDGQPKICQLDLVLLTQEQILRLDVSMHDALQHESKPVIGEGTKGSVECGWVEEEPRLQNSAPVECITSQTQTLQHMSFSQDMC